MSRSRSLLYSRESPRLILVVSSVTTTQTLPKAIGDSMHGWTFPQTRAAVERCLAKRPRVTSDSTVCALMDLCPSGPNWGPPVAPALSPASYIKTNADCGLQVGSYLLCYLGGNTI
ncbi:hypothetical protein THAOC_36154 [Thalassiosira oceanica]|uniref:Uncharacterized protein n=1 Tax=Thalassiosira oceanica TaxID=159749 RepID=K0RFD3_THAOC|nr:hypothetical protein THAOC_36154 [Thalassiosira oceanica]|eukprot:EJK45237.1 hypothetical protein THAOC_36154 [Thalassiosira oceanica]